MPLSASRIKLCRALHYKKGRLERNLFLVEGPDLIKEALKEGWPLREIILTHHFGKEVAAGKELARLADLAEVPCDFCSQTDMDRLTDTRTPQGAAALAELSETGVAAEVPPADVLLVCEQVSDPGNLGTLIRTADWFAVSRIVLGGGSTDPFSPKVVRSTAGSVFRVRTEIVEHLSNRIREEIKLGRELYAAMMGGNLQPKDLPIEGLRGLVVGHERRGVSGDIAALCTDSVRIEGRGRAESLNLAVAAGILLHALTS